MYGNDPTKTGSILAATGASWWISPWLMLALVTMVVAGIALMRLTPRRDRS